MTNTYAAPATLRYVADHDERNARLFDKGKPPRNLAELLTWARTEWAAEIPERLHAGGVEAQSILGTPKTAPEARVYFERSDHTTDAERTDPDDPHACYQKPMHAALWRIHRAYTEAPNATSSEHWWHARYLLALALNDFDWQGTAARFGLPTFAARQYTEWALRLWWQRYERAPMRT